MGKIICIILIFIGFSSCNKETCVSCIAESISGKIVNYSIECDKSDSYLNGYIDGLRNFHKDNGDTVVVRCISSN